MFAYPTVLNYFSRFSNEGRKFGLLLTGITHNAVAMLNNSAARNIVLNADFLMLLKQSPLDRMKWTELLNPVSYTHLDVYKRQRPYSLDSEAKAARDASKQLAKESGQAQEHVTDISDKLNPVR